MNIRNAVTAVGLTALLTPLCWGQTAAKAAGSLWIEGDSTLHRWSSTSTAVELTLTPAEALADAVVAVQSSLIKSAEARIPVASLKSGESGLDKNMRKAMNAEKFPDILYKLASYKPVQAGAGGVITASTSGELTINGMAKQVSIDMEFTPGPDGLHARGAYTLKMSDYGITPPKLMLGAIKVRDPVTVRFDLILTNTKKEKPQ